MPVPVLCFFYLHAKPADSLDGMIDDWLITLSEEAVNSFYVPEEDILSVEYVGSFVVNLLRSSKDCREKLQQRSIV